ncbi:hypothetical protein [Azorhizobium sp. AG788]|uniref:hypothetical protein n=1 Tax=Azorhizobium sp. AG788 TaxID=2183897 RepID=UPI00313A1B7B
MPGLRRHGLRLSVTGALLLGGIAPAFALLAPKYYEQARRQAPNVVVLAVETVTEPPAGYGACAVAGTVRKVERGRLYKPGAAVTIAVPCRKPGVQPPLGGTIYADPAALRAAPFGRAYLDAKGELLLSQYEALAKAP